MVGSRIIPEARRREFGRPPRKLERRPATTRSRSTPARAASPRLEFPGPRRSAGQGRPARQRRAPSRRSRRSSSAPSCSRDGRPSASPTCRRPTRTSPRNTRGLVALIQERVDAVRFRALVGWSEVSTTCSWSSTTPIRAARATRNYASSPPWPRPRRVTDHKRLNWAGTSNAAVTAERQQSLPSTGELGDSSFRRLVDRLAPALCPTGLSRDLATLVADATPSAVMHAMPGAADRLAVGMNPPPSSSRRCQNTTCMPSPDPSTPSWRAATEQPMVRRVSSGPK